MCVLGTLSSPLFPSVALPASLFLPLFPSILSLYPTSLSYFPPFSFLTPTHSFCIPPPLPVFSSSQTYFFSPYRDLPLSSFFFPFLCQSLLTCLHLCLFSILISLTISSPLFLLLSFFFLQMSLSCPLVIPTVLISSGGEVYGDSRG